ncbi:pentatricopeptide repeat-containing protein At1g77405 [Impatiens glandulifera]|uniref:pentatricopeptide repeat-containing protein At1g77405 n=1 Tax=Impatiens glandulifera TaxID=253017 RepID=UPI001FB05218|nr:pentatricopeptide repeat-containing protein At1g77405 [Impatiens glandulifera]
MISTRPLRQQSASLVEQILTIIIQNRPFDAKLAASIVNPTQTWTVDTVSEVLQSIPRFFFQSSRSIGRQKTFRHRTPIKQRKLQLESKRIRKGILVLGPSAHRDPNNVKLGLDKALEFFYWLENRFGFIHNERTCRDMACVLAKGNRLNTLWNFLKEMSDREDSKVGKLVTTMTITCLIKVLGEEGLVAEALTAFYRMKQFYCRPDVCSYNTIIHALCRVGDFKKAKFLLEQMELPGFRCPPDTFTYTILISSYCKHAMQTGCKKAIRRRMWEANHLFRIMVFKGFIPDIVTYNCLIDGCCKTHRIERALELFNDMKKVKEKEKNEEMYCVPNRVTYNSFIRYYSAVNEIDKAVEMLRAMGEEPSSSSYTPIIHAMCRAGRVLEARDFLVELVKGGSVPREDTFKLVCKVLDEAGEEDLLDGEIRRKIGDGIRNRYDYVRKVKPIMVHQ